MEVTRPAGARTDRQIAGDLRFAGCGKSRDLLVPHVYPFDFAPGSQRLRETVQAVTNDSVNPFDSGLLQRCHEKIGYILDRHQPLPRLSISAGRSTLQSGAPQLRSTMGLLCSVAPRADLSGLAA